MGKRIVEKVLSFLVDTEGQSYSKKFDLDKNVSLIKGVLLSSDYPNMPFYRGSQRIEISGDEIFPEEYESKLMMSGMSVSPDTKFKTLGDGGGDDGDHVDGVVAGNGVVKIQYKDTNNSNAPFAAYKVIIVLQCEMK